MLYALWLLLGLILGSGLLLYARSYRKGRAEKHVLANALIVAAVIYIGFALVWGDVRWIGIEIIGVMIYAAFGWAAKRHSVYWLAAGWALHPVWDVGLHLLGHGNTIAPEWYAIACISFDLLVAGYVLGRARDWTKKSSRYSK